MTSDLPEERPEEHHSAAIDSVILSCAGAEWVKINVLISKVFDALPAAGVIPHVDFGQIIAERLYILIDNGGLEVQGNMRRWRDASVKLPSKNLA